MYAPERFERKDPPASKNPELDKFIAFMEKQPAEYKYNYVNCEICPIAQYVWDAYGVTYFDAVANSHPVANQFGVWNLLITHPRPRNFGAAAERAKELKNYDPDSLKKRVDNWVQHEFMFPVGSDFTEVVS